MYPGALHIDTRAHIGVAKIKPAPYCLIYNKPATYCLIFNSIGFLIGNQCGFPGRTV